MKVTTLKISAGGKIAIAKQRRPHEGALGCEGVNQKKIEGRAGNKRFDDDFA